MVVGKDGTGHRRSPPTPGSSRALSLAVSRLVQEEDCGLRETLVRVPALWRLWARDAGVAGK